MAFCCVKAAGHHPDLPLTFRIHFYRNIFKDGKVILYNRKEKVKRTQ